jgi:phosphoglycerate kinase
VFVNDAFGTVHRRHASNYGIATNIGTSCIGFLIQTELENLARITSDPKRPVIAILGGAKVSDKLYVINNLLKIADYVLICGGMGYTFLKAQGHNIGFSLCEAEMVPEAAKLLNIGKNELVLPIDFYCAKNFADTTPIYKKLIEGLEGLMGLDIGPDTIKKFNQILAKAGTVF